MNLPADTGGLVDMKRIFGITAVEGKVRPGKGVKVFSLFPSSIFVPYIRSVCMYRRLVCIHSTCIRII